MITETERFWAKVAKAGPDECWLWTASVERSGHPVFYLARGKKMRGHRYSLQLSLGRPIGDGRLVCHRCDVPACVNPAHLYEGDHQSNSDDKVRAERQMRGSLYGRSRLTEADVEQIIRSYRAGGVTHRELSQRFGVSASQISLMINGKSWRHVYDALERAA